MLLIDIRSTNASAAEFILYRLKLYLAGRHHHHHHHHLSHLLHADMRECPPSVILWIDNEIMMGNTATVVPEQIPTCPYI